MPDPVILLGLGFTTTRLAIRLEESHRDVHAAVRNPERYAHFGVKISALIPQNFPQRAILVHTIPPLEDPEKSKIRNFVRAINPGRILYISSTSVYGEQSRVNETTAPAPQDEKGRARIDEEQWLTETGIPILIFRSAAIYGPGRGIHARLREGTLTALPRGAGGIVSRIHVDDLAAHLEAGIDSTLTGAWPVADERPATSEEIIAWCAKRMGTPLPEITENIRQVNAGRRVNGEKIRELLSVTLRYPSWETGIPASE